MNKLDEKLMEILNIVHKSIADEVQPWVIPQIHAAFKDAGYVQIPTATSVTVEGGDRLYNGNNKELMTGQEWYERFKQEMPKHFLGATNSYEKSLVDGTLAECNAAAKRAAGIEGKQE